MAHQIAFQTTAWTSGKPAAVYRLIADGRTWPAWSPIASFTLEREGEDGGESVGAIRLFGTGTVRSREQILELRPDEALRYTALSGLPIRAHRAEIRLQPHDSGTTITWHEEFEASVPGTSGLLHWFLRRFVQRCTDGLAAYADGRD